MPDFKSFHYLNTYNGNFTTKTKTANYFFETVNMLNGISPVIENGKKGKY